VLADLKSILVHNFGLGECACKFEDYEEAVCRVEGHLSTDLIFVADLG